ncbi:class I adenylate-forming enzyme family protein [Teredinibacter sp. KSP-S5-2]|uniref:class I adenylate-forming enzyme family protein n=1 Tax=Teredinibacter sp. KSP-S5-2 TaxID=3034506 RepID=UPI002934DBC0|nr:class I adenylate-forming enzyme family protein [Teredinibacter sp. KSP-S5-2]WNO08517.1 class I adenylate-forming enzyme family protein [Teredinibacter sp. KSP-S5-2]
MKTLVDQFLEIVSSCENNTAIIQGEQTTSYRQLKQKILSATHFLSTKGIQPGDRVCLLMENSADYVALYYAIWATGAVAVALNTGLMDEDIQNLCTHCGSKILIHDSRHVFASDSISVFESSEISEINSSHEILKLPKLEDTASIIYTSGTTGHPKGVTLSHKNLASNTNSIIQYLKLTAADRVMCILPFFYSYGNSLLHTHLAVGGSLVLENSFMYPQKVLEKMQATQATGFSGVPSTFTMLLDRSKLHATQIPSLRYVTQAGGGMSATDIEHFTSAWHNMDFIVMYGQTEASARLTYLPASMLLKKMGSAGKAIPGVEIIVRDEQGNPCPAGTQGEITARGPNIMQGYWNDQAETEKAVQQNWLYTGDLGYQDEDGYIYIIGRNKEMIKTGAHRIAPREIEEKIGELPGVLEVAVAGIPDRIMGQVIKAYIVKSTESPETLEPREIMRHCKEKLASYKIPKKIEFVSALPKTASGKVQKHLLM